MDSKTLRTLTVYVVWVMLIIKWVSTSLVNRKHCINKKYQTVWDAELSLGLLSLLLTLLPLRLPRWHYFDEPLWSSGVSKVAGVASLLFKTEFPKTADSESSSVSTQWGALSRGGGGSHEPNTPAYMYQDACVSLFKKQFDGLYILLLWTDCTGGQIITSLLGSPEWRVLLCDAKSCSKAWGQDRLLCPASWWRVFLDSYPLFGPGPISPGEYFCSSVFLCFCEVSSGQSTLLDDKWYPVPDATCC